ncbi:hypothetical protein FDA77_00855 [Clostridium botulinum]|nr:hypothetical protein [Clostridium botulinum]NFJ88498.1 hypothetical protein [Clostridium botulinum]HDI3121687.1 hypothetical protein [Clostridium botulinum]
MIDLDILMDKTLDFKLNGELIKVNQPSMKIIKKFNTLSSLSEAEILDKQTDVIVEILNNNTSGKKFKPSEVDNFSLPVINTIVNTVTNNINGTENNPN